MAHDLGHYVLGHPNYDDAHQRERDANAKGVEIMVRLGMDEDEALRRMHALLVAIYRFQARTDRSPSPGHSPCAEIVDLLKRFPKWRDAIPSRPDEGGESAPRSPSRTGQRQRAARASLTCGSH